MAEKKERTRWGTLRRVSCTAKTKSKKIRKKVVVCVWVGWKKGRFSLISRSQSLSGGEKRKQKEGGNGKLHIHDILHRNYFIPVIHNINYEVWEKRQNHQLREIRTIQLEHIAIVRVPDDFRICFGWMMLLGVRMSC